MYNTHTHTRDNKSLVSIQIHLLTSSLSSKLRNLTYHILKFSLRAKRRQIIQFTVQIYNSFIQYIKHPSFSVLTYFQNWNE